MPARARAAAQRARRRRHAAHSGREAALTYIKLDDAFPKHPKVAGLPLAAKWLYVESLCYASQYRTDGWVPDAILRDLGGNARNVGALVDAGLWEKHDRGWQIHDYLHHQRSKDQINQQKDATKRRLQRHRNAGGNAVTNADVTLHREAETKRHRGIEAEDDAEASSAAAAGVSDAMTICIRAFDGLMGRLASTEPIQRDIRRWLADGLAGPDDTEPLITSYRGESAEWFTDACETAARSDGRSMGYVQSILRRWKRDGRGSNTKRAGAGMSDAEINSQDWADSEAEIARQEQERRRR